MIRSHLPRLSLAGPTDVTYCGININYDPATLLVRENPTCDICQVNSSAPQILYTVKPALEPEMTDPNLPITLEQITTLRELIHDKSVDLIRSKGHDYNRQQQEKGDTLFNLQVCEVLGITDSQRGILVRLSDKFMRLISLIVPEAPVAKHESVIDTVVDIHNYVDYLLAKYLMRKGYLSLTIQRLDDERQEREQHDKEVSV